MRQPGSAGSKRIAPVEVRRDRRRSRRARRDATSPGVDLDAVVRPADRPHGRVEHDALAELARRGGAGSAASRRRRGTRGTAPPRRARTSRRRRRSPTAPGGARTSAPASSGSRRRGTSGGSRAPSRRRPPCRSHSSNVIVSSSRASRVRPRRLRIELLRERVELRVGLLQRALRGRREARVRSPACRCARPDSST